MIFRISSDYPCLLRADGEALGAICGEGSYAEANDFIELIPFSGKQAALPVCFSLSAPPPTVTVTDYGNLKDYSVCVPRLPEQTTEVLFQQSVALPRTSALVTVVRDGREKVTIDASHAFGVFDLPYGLQDFRTEYGELGGAPCIALFAARGGIQYAFVYDLSAAKLLLRGEAQALTWGNQLTVRRICRTLARHTVTTRWAYQGGSLSATDVAAVRNPDFSFFALREFQKPFALAEEYLVGGDARDFLSPALQEDADALSDYLGAFVAVQPPPALCNKKGAALLYPAPNGYTVKFLSATFTGGLIDNLTLK